MLEVAGVTKGAIRSHYDVGTLLYRWFWGQHIHHGLWRGAETEKAAQLQLVDRLAGLAELRAAGRVLDVGCGMGATALHLCWQYHCHVLGITLSGVQSWWARCNRWGWNLPGQVEFRMGDIEQLDWPPCSFDVVWNIECTEHLFDKAEFFRKAARWLSLGGRLAIAAWLARPRSSSAATQL
ncbi:27-O-demethylrifamycin SV methyltransferase [bacterium HR36]|nr:27-O-demethylrifamycin SV methyltransferase [bacterium HR36]